MNNPSPCLPHCAEIRSGSGGYASDEYEISSATDVFEVIAWATANSGARSGRVYRDSDRTFTLYAVAQHDGRITLVHPAGVDPTMEDSITRLE